MRRLVTVSAYVILFLGLFVISGIPKQPMYLFLGAALWTATCITQIARARRGWQRVDEIRVSQGPAFEVRGGGGDWTAAEPLSGTLLIGSVAWFRLRLGDQSVCVEPFRATGHRCNKWRRLQVIWRHVGAS